ncbi:MAG: hypothetical protein AMXMBFR84_18550 [Candidatus Hydrogenedentota bacterium]
MIAGIHQLHYLPWLRYIEKMARCDVFIVLDNIQYNKNGWQNRNRIKTANGPLLLTVPVHARLGDTLDQVAINNAVPWRKKHRASIEQAYRHAPFFDAYWPPLAAVYEHEWAMLNDLNRAMIDWYVRALGIGSRIVYASELNALGTATERLINLMKAVDGTRYYSGAYALEQYLDAEALAAAGIGLVIQEWRAPEYPQLHGPFVRDLSILDMMFHCGPDTLSIILEKRS